jgi:hypothetical protein
MGKVSIGMAMGSFDFKASNYRGKTTQCKKNTE